MSLTQFSFGMHGINNSWNPEAPAYSGITDTDLGHVDKLLTQIRAAMS